MGNYLFIGSNEGIYRSSDNGKTWTYLDNTRYTMLKVITISSIDNILYAGSTFGMFKSTDNGNNWQFYGFRRTPKFGIPKYLTKICSFNQVLFASFDDSCFLSFNKGNTWSYLNLNETFSAITAIAANDSGIYISNYFKIFRSTDSAKSWKAISTITNINQIFLKDSLIVLCDHNGAYRSQNFGKSYQYISFPNSSYTNASVSDGNSIFIGSSTRGMFYSNNFGLNWQYQNGGLKSSTILAMTKHNSILFCGDSIGNYSFDKNAAQWIPENNGLHNLDVYTLLATDGEIYFTTAKGGLYLTKDKGNTFQNICTDYSSTAFFDLLKIGDTLIAAISGKGVIVSVDNNYIWTQKNMGIQSLSGRFLEKIGRTLFLGTNSKLFYVNLDDAVWSWKSTSNGSISQGLNFRDNYVYASFYNGLFISNDKGKTWTKGTDSFAMSQNTYQIRLKDTIVYANFSFKGICRSLNNGKNWTLVVSNATLGISDYTIMNNKLIIGTYGQGFYACNLDGSELVSINDGFVNSYINDFVQLDGFLYSGTSSGFWKINYGEVFTNIESPKGYNKSDLYTYPNPISQNQMMVSYQSHLQFETYQILNYNGQVIMNGATHNNAVELKHSLSSGIYWLYLQNSNGETAITSFLVE